MRHYKKGVFCFKGIFPFFVKHVLVRQKKTTKDRFILSDKITERTTH